MSRAFLKIQRYRTPCHPQNTYSPIFRYFHQFAPISRQKPPLNLRAQPTTLFPCRNTNSSAFIRVHLRFVLVPPLSAVSALSAFQSFGGSTQHAHHLLMTANPLPRTEVHPLEAMQPNRFAVTNRQTITEFTRCQVRSIASESGPHGCDWRVGRANTIGAGQSPACAGLH